MSRSKPRRSTARKPQLERVEERLVLSADPTGAVYHQAAPDFRIEHLAAEIAQSSLSGAHARTGMADVFNTYGFSGAGQTVAIIDSGIAWDHPALGGGFGANYRVVGGYDFAENDNNPYDDGLMGSHGTHVAGIVGADAGSNSGVARGVDIVALRVFDDDGAGYFSWVEKALRWVHQNRNAFENPITTVNLSLGTDWNASTIPNWATLEDELAQLKADGIFISVAAGNSFASYEKAGLSYPAVSQYVVPVSSLDTNGKLSSFSQRHARVIAAPGSQITSTVPDYVGNQNGRTDDWSSYSGTSMAAPYVAGASVILREAMQLAGWKKITQDTIYNVMKETADQVYDAITGKSYAKLNVKAAIDSILSSGDDYGSSTANLGKVASTQLTGLNQTASETWYRLQASQAGTLTVEAFFSHSQGNVNLQMYSGNMQLLGTSNGTGNSERIDVAATAGATYYIKCTGANPSVSLRVTNLVRHEGEVVYVSGTSGNDSFTFAAGAMHTFTINGTAYGIAGNAASSIRFDGGAGHDTAKLIGTSANEHATLTPKSATLTADAYVAFVDRCERIDVYAGGGTDTASFTDSAGDDLFIAKPTNSALTGAGFATTAYQFESVGATASTGNDRARFFDTAGSQTFDGRAAYSTMKGSGLSYSASGFDRVDALSSGGNDRARFFDTKGNEVFTGRPDCSTLTGSGFKLTAKGFPNVFAYASGGDDRAVLYDSAGNDTLTARPQNATLAGPGYSIYTEKFDRVEVVARAGMDEANFYGSSGNDLFASNGKASMLSGTGYYVSGKGFDNVYADAGGGTDTAKVYEAPKTKSYTNVASFSVPSENGSNRYLRGFEFVNAHVDGGKVTVSRATTSARSSSIGSLQISALDAMQVALASRSQATLGVGSDFAGKHNDGTTRERLLRSEPWTLSFAPSAGVESSPVRFAALALDTDFYLLARMPGNHDSQLNPLDVDADDASLAEQVWAEFDGWK